jgi:hypothetical protein
MSDISREYDDDRLFRVFYATTGGHLPEEVIEWARREERQGDESLGGILMLPEFSE